MNKNIRQIAQKITKSFSYKLIIVMIIFNLPLFITSFFLQRKFLLNNLGSMSFFDKFSTNILFYRTFPDPFVISIDILSVLLIVSFLTKTWQKKLCIGVISILFIYQWYSALIILFFKRSPHFIKDWLFIAQIQHILNPLIFCMIILTLSLIIFSLIFFLKKFRNLMIDNSSLLPKNRIIICSCFILLWFIILHFSNKKIIHQKCSIKCQLKHSSHLIHYLNPVEFTLLNAISNIKICLNKHPQFQDQYLQLSYQKKSPLKTEPKVYLMIIESYGDIKKIINQENFINIKDTISHINKTFENRNIFSVSSFSTHSSSTFSSIMALNFAHHFSTKDLNLIQNEKIKKLKNYTVGLTTFFKQHGYTTVGLYPSLNSNSFQRFSYNENDFKTFFTLDSLILGNHSNSSESTYWAFPDHIFLTEFNNNYVKETKSPFFALYISSNSHFPFHSFNLEIPMNINLLNNDTPSLPLAAKIDQKLHIKNFKFNFLYMRTKYKGTILYSSLEDLIGKIRRSSNSFKKKLVLKKKYFESILYQIKTIEHFSNQIDDQPFIMFIIGDHQPHFLNYSNITPFHILSNNKHYLDYWKNKPEFSTGFHLNNQAPYFDHQYFASAVIESLKYFQKNDL